jgi:hypothetical protein
VQENTESYVVVDDNNQTLAFVYYEDEPDRQMTMKRVGKGTPISSPALFA